ncbi:MAG: hypothetical protein M1819_005401 [Sarea resinae]|nr:MAG: hypothetical protein M1819_005401 [Sarea resinae]
MRFILGDPETNIAPNSLHRVPDGVFIQLAASIKSHLLVMLEFAEQIGRITAKLSQGTLKNIESLPIEQANALKMVDISLLSLVTPRAARHATPQRKSASPNPLSSTASLLGKDEWVIFEVPRRGKRESAKQNLVTVVIQSRKPWKRR